jgi:transposase-like protein
MVGLPKGKRQVSARVKFQVVLEILTEDKTLGQLARAYGIHPHLRRAVEEDLSWSGARRSLPETVPRRTTSAGLASWSICPARKEWRSPF